MEFAVYRLSLGINHFVCVAAIAVHEPITIGYTTVREMDRRLVGRLWAQTDHIPEHIRILWTNKNIYSSYKYKLYASLQVNL